MPELLSASDWASIRALVDVSLTTTQLTDDVIAMDVYSGAAQRAVLLRDSQAESRGGTERDHAKAAAQYLTAALLVPAVLTRQEFEQSGGQENFRVKYGVQDLRARSAELRGLAEAELDAYLNTDTDPSGDVELPTLFGMACGRRGR